MLFTKSTCIEQLYVQNFADLQHCILLRDKLVTNVVMHATEGFNLQCNNVTGQVEDKCCPYYRTLTTFYAVGIRLTISSIKLPQIWS